MKIKSIKKHLRRQTIGGRRSTWSHAFASALASYDIYSDADVAAAIRDQIKIQQATSYVSIVMSPPQHGTISTTASLRVNSRVTATRCATWSPAVVLATSERCQKHWRAWLELLNPPQVAERLKRIERFVGARDESGSGYDLISAVAAPELERFLEIRQQVFELIKEADGLASIIHEKLARTRE